MEYNLGVLDVVSLNRWLIRIVRCDFNMAESGNGMVVVAPDTDEDFLKPKVFYNS